MTSMAGKTCLINDRRFCQQRGKGLRYCNQLFSRLWVTLWFSSHLLSTPVCNVTTCIWSERHVRAAETDSPLLVTGWDEFVCVVERGKGAQSNQGLLKPLSSTNGLNANQSPSWWKTESSKFGIILWQTGIWDKQTQFGHILLGFESHQIQYCRTMIPFICSGALLSLQLS